jgi:hypothetical protein
MQACGGAETAFEGMLITSAVAIFFSCSGATEFSVSEFDLPELRRLTACKTLSFQTPVEIVLSHRLLRWTDQPGERHDDSSSFLGTELSILTLLPERSVRKTL